ncbi:Ldh family oxidoreductase, partial [Bosea sp. (in: a-proteobacteria)]|uniref:Ldh family oxidoreductase n=1 Tax=Bosea sp. (in: a-proteobacteria) TaxID=1871050 RepID=UPI003342843F
MSHKLHRPEALRSLIRDMVTKAGWSEPEAQETADHLVLANLSGHDSHGVGMIPLYFQSLADGNLKPESKGAAPGEAAPLQIVDRHKPHGPPQAP